MSAMAMPDSPTLPVRLWRHVPVVWVPPRLVPGCRHHLGPASLSQPSSTHMPRATPGLTRCTQSTAPWIPVPQLPWGPPSYGGSSDRQIAAGVSPAGSGPRGHPPLESPHTRIPGSLPQPPLRGDSTVAQPWHHPLRDPQPVTPTLTRVLDVAHNRHFNLKILAGRVCHVHNIVASKNLAHQGVRRRHGDT